jgi:hypothetical protein
MELAQDRVLTTESCGISGAETSVSVTTVLVRRYEAQEGQGVKETLRTVTLFRIAL